MGSYNFGKEMVCAWVRENFSEPASILDVGACDGKWRLLLPEYENMDAVEAHLPNAERLQGYRHVYPTDIRNFAFTWYDLVIFGDVIEHLPVADAQAVLEYARTRCSDMIVAVPFLYRQGEIDGNPYEIHVQDDLTPELFAERYPGFRVLCRPVEDYCYYIKGGEPVGGTGAEN